MQDPSSKAKQPQIPISTIRRQYYRYNSKLYPYARSHHYYYKIQALERIGNTTYVVDPSTSLFNYHDPLETILHNRPKDQWVNIINRKYIGIPIIRQNDKLSQSRQQDKNICHEYLFKNEDIKYKIDQLLYDLRFIKKNPNLIEQMKLKNFLTIRTSVQFSPLLDSNISDESKKIFLNKKIQYLEHLRRSAQQQWYYEDKIFYNASNNQKFYDAKLLQEQELYCYYKMRELKDKFIQQENLFNQEKQTNIFNKIQNILKLYTYSKIQKQPFKNSVNLYIQKYLQYRTILPAYIFNFDDQSLNKIYQIIYHRTFLNAPQSPQFLKFKVIWKKLFKVQYSQHQLWLYAYDELQYQQIINKILQKKQQLKNNLSNHNQINLPEEPFQSSQFFLQKQPLIQITFTELLIIHLIFYIKETLQNINFDYRIFGFQYFDKYCLPLFETGNHNIHFMNIDYAIKQVIEYFYDIFNYNQVEENQLDLFWQYENQIGIIWSTEKEVWKTQKESNEIQQKDLQSQNQEQNDDLRDSLEPQIKKKRKLEDI